MRCVSNAKKRASCGNVHHVEKNVNYVIIYLIGLSLPFGTGTGDSDSDSDVSFDLTFDTY